MSAEASTPTRMTDHVIIDGKDVGCVGDLFAAPRWRREKNPSSEKAQPEDQ